MHDLVVTRTLTIPAAELEWTAVRSGGPGGQNVNKVATKVELRFDPARSAVLPAPVVSRLQRLAAARLDSSGRIVVTADETRSQRQNLELARERLAALVRAALVIPKRRRPTRPTAASERKRLDQKRKVSAKKRERRVRSWD
ncbi:MAG TPA: alternative ribosome rescue aminoacyl-tRNA hydrolase ArfB [Polyangiaceae bacterium]|nr:alternative ribosome rescue aminoacyl-tRNA hydrolase ArfB [Polyangiaceae bacterium]